MKEPALVLKARKALEADGYYVAKIHGGQFSAGIPDLLICVDGAFVGLEFKLPGKERNATALQKAQIDAIRRAGGVAWVVSSVLAALEVCDRLPTAEAGGDYVYSV